MMYAFSWNASCDESPDKVTVGQLDKGKAGYRAAQDSKHNREEHYRGSVSRQSRSHEPTQLFPAAEVTQRDHRGNLADPPPLTQSSATHAGGQRCCRCGPKCYERMENDVCSFIHAHYRRLQPPDTSKLYSDHSTANTDHPLLLSPRLRKDSSYDETHHEIKHDLQNGSHHDRHVSRTYGESSSATRFESKCPSPPPNIWQDTNSISKPGSRYLPLETSEKDLFKGSKDEQSRCVLQ